MMLAAWIVILRPKKSGVTTSVKDRSLFWRGKFDYFPFLRFNCVFRVSFETFSLVFKNSFMYLDKIFLMNKSVECLYDIIHLNAIFGLIFQTVMRP